VRNLTARPHSPITGRDNVELVRTWQACDLTARWEVELGIDIARAFADCQVIYLWRCLDSGLLFFKPSIIGDERLYDHLQRFDWYYANDKWEFRVALSGLAKGQKILEIGCGRGAFLKMAREKGLDACGLELNERACAMAREEGLTVYRHNLYNCDLPEAGTFDACFAFQVLEHVEDPFRFCRAMLGMVKSGGMVGIAVPNADSFVGRSETILDIPPHHVTRWLPQSFAVIAKLLNASLGHVLEGPLEPIHIPFWVNMRFQELKRTPFGALLSNHVTRRSAQVALKMGLRRLVKGHTLYVELVKCT
jgi:2-polyprenyl-3-methyl-5-hydroxy-6-metoxy-1,4-benzoquinol methylase